MDVLLLGGYILVCMLQVDFVDFINIHYANDLESISNHLIEFGRGLTDFVIGNHMNTSNELNSFLMAFYYINGKFSYLVYRYVVTTIDRYS